MIGLAKTGDEAQSGWPIEERRAKPSLSASNIGVGQNKEAKRLGLHMGRIKGVGFVSELMGVYISNVIRLAEVV